MSTPTKDRETMAEVRETVSGVDQGKQQQPKPPYGHLSVVCGPMFAGKTTETLKRILWAKNGRGQDIRVYKPAFDQRYARLQIVSHEGLAADAEAVHDWDARTAEIIDAGVAVVFFGTISRLTSGGTLFQLQLMLVWQLARLSRLASGAKWSRN